MKKLFRISAAIQTHVHGPWQIDGADVGRDQKFAVSDQYQTPFAFTGKLKKVTIRYQ